LGFNEPGERTVIGLFHVGRKTTRRELLHLHMISQAFAALSLAVAGIVCAVAILHIFADIAFHGSYYIKKMAYVNPV
jgi:hypothetical protein